MPHKAHAKLEFMFMKHYAPNRCEPSIEALNFGGRGGGDQGRCERRIQKKNLFLVRGSGGGGGGGVGLGGSG